MCVYLLVLSHTLGFSISLSLSRSLWLALFFFLPRHTASTGHKTTCITLNPYIPPHLGIKFPVCTVHKHSHTYTHTHTQASKSPPSPPTRVCRSEISEISVPPGGCGFVLFSPPSSDTQGRPICVFRFRVRSRAPSPPHFSYGAPAVQKSENETVLCKGSRDDILQVSGVCFFLLTTGCEGRKEDGTGARCGKIVVHFSPSCPSAFAMCQCLCMCV